ncbi:DivIVA domain-containing protein [Kineosporia sp. J2-2]|uniref:Cell wall synthesis protein Wag31 n=1 Tax=Kineosporia corallincola TaxID=2835133 RepID=A0ABS5TJ11_9ACTN|nr:DivIVA domain-containing protein [Kineosporia corallincola]MBT0771092.1 DivIVA domain-containing protein [Kineosporia corallincola]
MALTPEDVVNKRFQATKFREGYDQDEVDDFLDEVVNELRRLNEENEELRGKLSSCERRVGELSRANVARESAPEPAPAPMPTPPPAPQPVAAVVPEPVRVPAVMEAAPQGPEAAAGMLALAQKLHDEYVRNGEQTRDRIVGEAREHSNRLIREAEEKQRQTLGSLEQERSLLERKIDELRAFEREYRSRLKSYLEGQLRELESKAAVVPTRGPQQPQSQPAGVGAAPYGAPLPTRGGYSDSGADAPAQYPFGGQS